MGRLWIDKTAEKVLLSKNAKVVKYLTKELQKDISKRRKNVVSIKKQAKNAGLIGKACIFHLFLSLKPLNDENKCMMKIINIQ